MKVYVSAKLPEEALDLLRRHAEVVGAEGMAEAEAAIVFNITREELARMPKLKFIQVVTAGLDHLPWQDIPPHVLVAGNAGANADAVAEFAVAMALASLKRIVFYDRRMKAGDYGRSRPVPMLRGRKAAVLGLGEIGQRTARILAQLGAEVWGFSRRMREGPWRFTDSLEEALRGALVAVCALPLNRHTRGLVRYEHLASMDPEGVFVNVGRAEVVDREAVLRILKERPGFTFASDVWWGRNDFGRDSEIISLPNAVATPWVAGGYGSEEVWRRMGLEAVENFLRWARGEPPRNIADRSDYV